MLQHSNIDRQASVEVSPAPFTYTSTLDLNGMTLPANSFLALKVYVSERFVMPFRFHSIRPDGKVMLCDARGVIVGYWQTFEETEAGIDIVVDPQTSEETVLEIDYVSSLLLDTQGVIMGYIACTKQALSLIRRVVISTLDTVFLDPQAFVLLPQCHISVLSGFGRSIGVQSQNEDTHYHTGDLKLVALGGEDSQLHISIDAGDDKVLSVGLSNKRDTVQKRASEEGQNGVCSIVVAGQTVDCIGKSIIIKAAATSNLRVNMDTDKIVLRGVNNA